MQLYLIFEFVLTRELLASALEEVLDADALLLGDAGGEAESLDAAAHADAEISFIRRFSVTSNCVEATHPSSF